MKPHRRLKRFLTVAIVFVIALALTGAGCADRLILPPVPHAVRHDGSPRIAIPYRDGVAEAFTARSPGCAAAGAAGAPGAPGAPGAKEVAKEIDPRAFVLRFSGDAAGAARFIAGRWEHRPVEAWAVNYPGYGGSTGPRTLSALAAAALAAFDTLRATAGTRPIFIEGFSLGTVPALHVAAHRAVAGLILQNPPPLRPLIIERNSWWNLGLLSFPLAWQVPHEFDSIANARAANAPAVFLMAERDGTVPLSFQKRIADAHAGPTRVIVQANADHADPLSDADVARLHDAMDWLWQNAQPH